MSVIEHSGRWCRDSFTLRTVLKLRHLYPAKLTFMGKGKRKVFFRHVSLEKFATEKFLLQEK